MVEMLARLEASGDLKRVADALPRLLERMEMLERLLRAFDAASAATDKGPHAAGGFGGLWSLMREADNQESLRFLINLGKALRAAPHG